MDVADLKARFESPEGQAWLAAQSGADQPTFAAGIAGVVAEMVAGWGVDGIASGFTWPAMPALEPIERVVPVGLPRDMRSAVRVEIVIRDERSHQGEQA